MDMFYSWSKKIIWKHPLNFNTAIMGKSIWTEVVSFRLTST